MKKDVFETYRALVERTLKEVLPKANARPVELSKAMRYAVGSGGKRLRPCLCFASAVAVGGKPEDARYAAAAIELMHNYTLVHDDLPAMDNDTMRRGKPSVWKKFGEANAILCGDALQALAFQAAVRTEKNAELVVDSLTLGGEGVVCGQVAELAGLNVPEKRKNDWQVYVNIHKTADLFVSAALMGKLSVSLERKCIKPLIAFAYNFGLAFQYGDDLLDGDTDVKPADIKKRVRAHVKAALAELKNLPGDTKPLEQLAKGLVDRKI